MLKMTGICKAYRTEVLEIFALRDLSIHVRESEFIAVTGPSGCGKTAFLMIAGMLDSFNEGEYELDGVNVYRMNDRERSWLRNEKIGFVFQSFNLLNDLKHDLGVSMVFISHDLAVVRYIADSIVVLRHGVVAETGSAESVYNDPQAEYTKKLLAAAPGPRLGRDPTNSLVFQRGG